MKDLHVYKMTVSDKKRMAQNAHGKRPITIKKQQPQTKAVTPEKVEP